MTPHAKLGKFIGAFLVAGGLIVFTILLAELNDILQNFRFGADKTLQERLGELTEVIQADNDSCVSQEECGTSCHFTTVMLASIVFADLVLYESQQVHPVQSAQDGQG